MEKNHQSPERQTIEQKKSPESECLRASEELKYNKRAIKELWEMRVREQILAAEGKSSAVMIDSLDIFLEELVLALAQTNTSPTVFSVQGMAKVHGGQRATFSGYLLPQLLKEFSILREVIVEMMNSKGVLTYDVRAIIDRSTDSAISLAATEFAKVQDAMTKTALSKAEMSNLDLEHFAAVAAHDLKSPLATISGYLNLLDEEFGHKLGKDGLGYVHFMNKASGRMLNLIDRLLDYARLTKVDKPFQPTNVNDVIEGCLHNLVDAIEKKNARVTYSSMPTVMGDIDLLTQLFQNLIANGIKFHSDTPSKIHIDVEEKDDMWLFSVRDNGIGFDPKDREHIFALYKKLHGESDYQGTGIGLATCRKVVELHGGRIWAESKPNIGSTFYFTLPRSKSDNEVKH
jgi:signal transduction histidine kinase